MELTITIICAIVTLFWFAITLKCIIAQKNIRWLTPLSDASPQSEKISIIMPARNEAEDIAASLHSLLGQKGFNFEIIVVNDHSTDETAKIVDTIAATDSQVRVLHDPPLTPGWLGKANAMQQGAALATGDYLLFTDADIIHARGGPAAVMQVMRDESLDFVSLFPLFENRTLWENINMPIYFFGVAKLLASPGLENPDSKEASASGAFMLIKKSVFQEVGGFEGVKGEMLDDIGLARLLKKKGCRVGYRLAPECLRVRLFKGNMAAFWGTTKNILTAIEGNSWLAFPLILLVTLQYWTPPVAMIAGLLKGNALLYAIGAITYTLQYASIFTVRRLFSFSPLKVLFFPLVVIVGACCITKAVYHQSKGAVFWKGREIRVDG